MIKMKITNLLKKIQLPHIFHKWVYFCEPTEPIQYDKYRYCIKCGQFAQSLYTSWGVSYCHMPDENTPFVESWIENYEKTNHGRYRAKWVDKIKND